MRTAYHHGDARAALIAAGLKLLETTPATALSLRQVAEAAGLSRQAPYNHFDGKEGLLAALAQASFAALTAAMDEAVHMANGQQDALEAIAASYIRFAVASPQRFRLMFQRELVDLARFPEAAAAGSAAFARIAGLVAAFAAEDKASPLAVAAWAMVHGYATLMIETGFEQPDQIPARARMFATIISNTAHDRDAAERGRFDGSGGSGTITPG